jgi:adenylate cyclase
VQSRQRGVPFRRLSIAAAAMLVAALILTVYRPPFLIRLDNDVYDVLTRSADREPPAGRVVIVDIDERSLGDVGQWPWPRDVVARLIERIRDSGASAIALDIVFPERDREVRAPGAGVPEYGRRGEPPPTSTDLALAETLRQGRVVLGYAMTFDDAAPRRPCVLHPLPAARVSPAASGGSTRLYRASGAICSLPLLADAAGASGFLNAAPDADGVLRRVPLIIESNDRLYPSLSLAAVLAMTGDREIAVRAADAQTTWLTFGGRRVPLDGSGNALVRYLGPERTFAYVSAVDVLANRTSPDAFARKLVFVGATALGTQEDIPAPVQSLFPGVEIQATVAESLLEGRAVQRAGYASLAEAVLILLGIPMVWLVSRAGAAWGAGLLAGLGVLLWLGAEQLFARGLFASPLLGIAGVAAAYIATVVVRLREERRQESSRASEATRAAAAAESVTRDVLRKTSHELRTPLTVVAGWAHLLGIGALSERQKNAALATIRENVRTQTRLIEELVDASKAADGTLHLELRRIDVRDVVRPAIAHYAGVFAAKRIRFDAAIDDAPCVVSGDPERLRQVIDALLSNASKFTPEGGTVTLRIGRPGGQVEIVVADTGIGIAPAFVSHLFERFRQQHGETPDPRGGLGLGLTIARKIVELHGGSIRAESAGENQGATFVVWLPVAGELD